MQKSYVYFMKHKDDNRIKIGKANDMLRRWNQLGNNFDFNSSYFKECESEKFDDRKAQHYRAWLHRKPR